MHQLRERLLKAEIEDEIIDEVVGELLSLGYLDDEAFALSVVRSEMRKKKSTFQAFLKLKSYGIEEGLAKRIISENYEEKEGLKALVEKGKRLNRPVEKLIPSLMRKGYLYEDIVNMISIN